MGNYNCVRICEKQYEIEKIFVDIVDEIIKEPYEYNNFFFTRHQKDEYQNIDIFIDKHKLTLRDVKLKEYSATNVINLRNDVKFNECNGLFGVKGDEFFEKFYKVSNYRSIDMIRNSLNSYSQKLDDSMEIMILNLNFNYKSIKEGYIIYAICVDSFFTRWNDMDKVRCSFEKKYIKNKEYIIKKIKKIIKNNYSENENKKLIFGMKELRNEMIGEFENNTIQLFQLNDERNPDLVYRSIFYQEIQKNNIFNNHINTNEDYLSSRMCTLLIYSMLKKVGIKDVDKYLVAYYIYRGIEDIYGVSAIEYIKKFS